MLLFELFVKLFEAFCDFSNLRAVITKKLRKFVVSITITKNYGKQTIPLSRNVPSWGRQNRIRKYFARLCEGRELGGPRNARG